MLICALSVVAAASSLNAASLANLVQAADRIRTPSHPYHTVASLEEYDAGVPKSQLEIEVFVKIDDVTGQYRNVIRYKRPVRDAGKMLLASGRNYWFYDPASRASIRISPQQQILGQASVADVLSVNFARQYKATSGAPASVLDAGKVARQATLVKLHASVPQAAYTDIDLWVDARSAAPIKAKFYSESGVLLKTLYYRGYRPIAGQDRPTEAVILDGVRPSRVTVVRFAEPDFVDIPEAWFQKDYLPRLSTK